MKRFLLSALLVSIVSLSLASVSFAEENSFVDIGNSYAKDAITELQAKGILTGVDGKHFDPQGKLTRAQFVVIMVKSLGLEVDANATSSFTDVKGWAVPYVEAALKAGIVSGVSKTKFAPNATVTREMSATILVRSLQTQGKLDDKDAILTFKDADSISDWAKPYIALAAKYGLIKGNPDGTFDPKGKATREMAAVMGSNLLVSIDVVIKENNDKDKDKQPEPSTPPVSGGGGVPPVVTPPTDGGGTVPPVTPPSDGGSTPPTDGGGTTPPPATSTVEFAKTPSFTGAMTSDFSVTIDGQAVTNFSLYYKGQLVGTTTNGVVTSVNNVFADINNITIQVDNTNNITDTNTGW